MSTNYGQMVSFADAVEWVEQYTCDGEMKPRVLARLKYERDQNVPVPVKKYKGKRITEYNCGNCGRGVDVNDRFCPNCGFAIWWKGVTG